MTMNKTAKIIGIVVGSLIIVMGLYMLIAAMSTSTGAYFSTTYSIDYSFGADFYTEMYGVTYDAVGQLNKIANGLDAAFDKTLPLLQIIAMGIGMLIIAIGAAVTAFFALSKVAESAPKAEGETSKFSEAMTKVGDTMKSTATPAVASAPPRSLWKNNESRKDHPGWGGLFPCTCHKRAYPV